MNMNNFIRGIKMLIKLETQKMKLLDKLLFTIFPKLRQAFITTKQIGC